ncbi:helix-turn-helix transcriptional regulator [Streptomyces sp. ISL-66]|uniref:helix-turn-helix domain-containing protein n=1 Tax=Streptomyces sp. ISL-66 TaxID=2819186 RepID=UPI0025563B7F|nr:helix-turn-helix transcriptional regulator [Streptomyces sp. ISL-66]
MTVGSGRTWTHEGANPWDQLAAEMRRIKDAQELSYARLAQRSHYSRSSWERILNSKQLPTRVALEQFATAVGQDARPLLDRLERCLHHSAAARRGSSAPARRPHPRRARPAGTGALALASAAGAVVGGLITLALTRGAPWVYRVAR